MASTSGQQAFMASPHFVFSASPDSTSLGLMMGSSGQNNLTQGRKVGKQFRLGPAPAILAASASAPASSAPQCGFTTRGSASSARTLVGRKSLARSRLAGAPFASMTLAAATMTAPSPSSAAPKKKKSLSEVLENASKKALSGGLPGMIAMGLQVSAAIV